MPPIPYPVYALYALYALYPLYALYLSITTVIPAQDPSGSSV